METETPLGRSIVSTNPQAALDAFRLLAGRVVIRPWPAFPEAPIETPFGAARIRPKGLKTIVVTTGRGDGVRERVTQVPLVVNRVAVQCDYHFALGERGVWVPQGSTYSYLRRVDGKELSWNAREKIEKALKDLVEPWAAANPGLLRQAESVRLSCEAREWESKADATLTTLKYQLEQLQAAERAAAAWQGS